MKLLMQRAARLAMKWGVSAEDEISEEIETTLPNGEREDQLLFFN